MKSKHDVRVQQSRRRFLADTALGAAGLGLGAAGMESAQARTKWEKMIKGLQTVTTDVLIVGSGAAGTAAAIEARRSGASVLVIEKMGSLGGSSIISRGALAVPRSPMQRAMGIDDSPEHFADDLMSSAYCGHPGRIECLALEALPTFEWLTNEIGGNGCRRFRNRTVCAEICHCGGRRCGGIDDAAFGPSTDIGC